MRIRLLLMALQIAIWGAWAPKLFPYMTVLGFSAGQQALVGGSWGIAAIVGIFFSNQFADRYFSAERFLSCSHLLGGLCLLITAYSTSFVPFFVGYLAYSLVYVPTLSVTNALAFANLAHPARDFGAVRMGGTIGWVMASWPFVFLLGTDANALQMSWILIISALLSLALSAYALTLPHTPPKRGDNVDKLAWREAVGLLRSPSVFVLFVVTFIDAVVHNGYFVTSDAFLTDRVGIARNLSMLVLSIGQIAEILTMFILGRVLVRWGWRTTLTLGILGHAARFLVFAFAADSVPTIIAVQLLHGVCYAFFFATVYIFVDEVFPNDVRTSAQGLFNLLILGIGMVVASSVFPALIEALSSTVITDGVVRRVVDYRTLFLIPGGLAAFGALLLVLMFRPSTTGPAAPIP